MILKIKIIEIGLGFLFHASDNGSSIKEVPSKAEFG